MTFLVSPRQSIAEPELECTGICVFACLLVLFLFSNITIYWPSIWEFWYNTNLRVNTALVSFSQNHILIYTETDVPQSWKNKSGGKCLSSGMSVVLQLHNVESLLCSSYQALLRKAAATNLRPIYVAACYKIKIKCRGFSDLYSHSVSKTGILVLSKKKFEKMMWQHKARAFQTSICAELITSQSLLRNNGKCRRRWLTSKSQCCYLWYWKINKNKKQTR